MRAFGRTLPAEIHRIPVHVPAGGAPTRGRGVGPGAADGVGAGTGDAGTDGAGDADRLGATVGVVLGDLVDPGTADGPASVADGTSVGSGVAGGEVTGSATQAPAMTATVRTIAQGRRIPAGTSPPVIPRISISIRPPAARAHHDTQRTARAPPS